MYLTVSPSFFIKSLSCCCGVRYPIKSSPTSTHTIKRPYSLFSTCFSPPSPTSSSLPFPSPPIAHPEFAAHTDKSQLLGVHFRLMNSFREQSLDECILTYPNQLLQTCMKSIIILVQKLGLRNRTNIVVSYRGRDPSSSKNLSSITAL